MNVPETSSQQQPLPVPPGIRTQRQMSRYLAISAIGLWLTSYILGVSVLTTEAQNRHTAFDELLETGSRQWAIRDRSTKLCLGVVQSNFSAENKPELTLSGTMTVGVYGHSALVSFDFRSKFTSYYKLEAIRADVHAGAAELKVTSEEHDAASLNVAVSVPSNLRRISLRRPEPIYLVERKEGQYSVRFPHYLQGWLDSSSNPHADITTLAGMYIAPLNSDEVDSCLAESKRIQSSNSAPSGILDLGQFLKYLGVDPANPAIGALTQQNT